MATSDGAGDLVTPLRRRLLCGEWQALTEPVGEGLLMMATLDDASWWPEAWAACLAELLRPWWARDRRKRFQIVDETTEVTEDNERELADFREAQERDRQRWWAGICPRYSLERARTVLRAASAEMLTALEVLGRWLPA